MSSRLHDYSQYGFSTRAIHVGSEPDAVTGAVIPAISLSTTYKQDSVGIHKACASVSCHAQLGSDLRPAFQGYEYSRSDNPNRRALETQLAVLEGGEHGLAFASGSAATATVFNAIGPGSHVISVNDVYGGTFRYMKRVAKENQGVDVTFLDLENAEEGSIYAALRSNTKVRIRLYRRSCSDTEILHQ
jgi:cystathionine gamma-lyase